MFYLTCFARTGATLLSKILSNHPKVYVTAELPLTEWVDNLHSIENRYAIKLSPNLNAREVSSHLKRINVTMIYRYWIMGIHYGRCKWSDIIKSRLLTKLRLVESDMHIVLLRDFKDTICSLKEFLGKYSLPNDDKDLYEYSTFYLKYLERLNSIHHKLVILYEDLASSPFQELRKIGEYCKINVDQSMLNLEHPQNSILTSGDYKIQNTRSVVSPRLYDHASILSLVLINFIQEEITPVQNSISSSGG